MWIAHRAREKTGLGGEGIRRSEILPELEIVFALAPIEKKGQPQVAGGGGVMGYSRQIGLPNPGIVWRSWRPGNRGGRVRGKGKGCAGVQWREKEVYEKKIIVPRLTTSNSRKGMKKDWLLTSPGERTCLCKEGSAKLSLRRYL